MKNPELGVLVTENDTLEVTVHARATHGNYATLCGVSTDDDTHTEVEGIAVRIDCEHCWSIFTACRALRKTDFSAAYRGNHHPRVPAYYPESDNV